jgi:biopolymer transport protein ExbD
MMTRRFGGRIWQAACRIIPALCFAGWFGVAFAQAPDAPAPDVSATLSDVATLPRDLSPWGMFENADVIMIAAPLAAVDISVELPVSNAQARPHPDRPLLVTLKSDLSLAVGDTSVTRERLGPVLDEATGGNRSERVSLRTDKRLTYGDLTQVMNPLRAAGYLKVSLEQLETDQPH